MTSISIILPVLNEKERIEQAVDNAWAAGADEVLVVDGGSDDGTRPALDRLKCQVVDGPPGRGPQMNAGAAKAKSTFLLFLHADNGLVAGACDQIRDRSDDPGFQFGGFRQVIDNPGWIYRWIESGNAWRLHRRGLIYGDQAFFIRRDLFQRLGGFPSLPIMEDLAFSRQLKRWGRPVLLPGPTTVGARRWERYGPVRQTVRNWFLSTAFLCGASPEWLSRKYRRHDQEADDPETTLSKFRR